MAYVDVGKVTDSVHIIVGQTEPGAPGGEDDVELRVIARNRDHRREIPYGRLEERFDLRVTVAGL